MNPTHMTYLAFTNINQYFIFVNSQIQFIYDFKC